MATNAYRWRPMLTDGDQCLPIFILDIRSYKCYLFSIVLSFIYACFDEFHQLYVVGRTGQFIDIGIDMIGVLFGVLVVYVYGLLVKVWSNRKEKHSGCVFMLCEWIVRMNPSYFYVK